MGDMGGLRKYMPVTHITFLIACLAIAGIPPFSGFFSKDEILAAAFHHDKILFFTLWIVAGLTAFYMFRLYFNIFWGKDRPVSGLDPDRGERSTPHESPLIMTVPLIFLAVLSCFTGFIPFSSYISADNMPFTMHIDGMIAFAGVAIALIGIFTAKKLYMKGDEIPTRIATQFGGFYKATLHKFYLDEVWLFITRSVIFKYISTPIAWFDRHIVDGTMDGIGWVTHQMSSSIKVMQSGKVQTYAWIFVVGAIVITIWALFL